MNIHLNLENHRIKRNLRTNINLTSHVKEGGIKAGLNEETWLI